MIKNQKGITIISLAIIIIVLLILSSVVLVTSIDLIKASNIRNYVTTMSLVGLEAQKIFEDFEFENDVNDMTLEGLDLSKIEITGAEKYTLEAGTRIPLQDKLIEQEKNIILNKIEYEEDSNSDGVKEVDVDNLWYKWSETTLNELKIDYRDLLKENQYFIINYATGEVIFPYGLKSEDDIVFYSLSGIKNLN